MSKLRLYSLEKSDRLATPLDYEKLTASASALSTFSDFKEFRPLVIEEGTKAIDALTFLEKAHVEFKIVIGQHNQCVGILSLDDLSEDKMIKAVSRGLKREEVLVGDMMTGRSNIWAFDYQDISKTSVLELVEVMKKNGLNYSLVVDHRVHEIRGIISAKDIANRLHIPFEPNKPPTFMEIFEIIHV